MSSSKTYGRNAIAKRKLDGPIISHETSLSRPLKRSKSIAETPSVVATASPSLSTPLPTPAVPATPTKLTKRMLGRSKTDSSLDSGPSPSRSIAFTTSLPALTSPPKTLPVANPSQDAPPLKRATSIKRTYAGKSRSFLVSQPVGIGNVPDETEEDEFAPRESYASLRSRWGVDNSEDDPYLMAQGELPSPTRSISRTNSIVSTPSSSPRKVTAKGKARALPEFDLPNGMMNPLKSITELRSKGESRRFLDEVGYLFEGMEPGGGIGLRRATALEITTSLLDPEFSRKAKAAEFFGKTWDIFIEAAAGSGKDTVLDIILLFFALLVSRDKGSLSDLAERPNSLPAVLFTLLSMVTPATDPLYLISTGATDIQLKKLGFGKSEQMLLRTIHTSIKTRTSIFSTNVHISTTLLISHTLSELSPAHLPASRIPTLLTVLKQCMSTLPSPLTRTATTAVPVPFLELNGLLRLLDSYLLGQWLSQDDESLEDDSHGVLDAATDQWFADGLAVLGVHAEIASTSSDDDTDTDSAKRCTETLLRTLVSLTHSDKVWCEKLVGSGVTLPLIMREIVRADNTRSGRGSLLVKAEEDAKPDMLVDDGSHSELPSPLEQAAALDHLCLALGVLTNLVQFMPKIQDTLRDLEMCSRCPTSVCTCAPAERRSALHILVDVYAHQLPPTELNVKQESLPDTVDTEAADADASFLLGHLSLLFGMLMNGNTANQSIIINVLPSNGESKAVKLNRLIEHARELGAFYRAVSYSHTRSESQEEGEKGVELAREVVKALRGM